MKQRNDVRDNSVPAVKPQKTSGELSYKEVSEILDLLFEDAESQMQEAIEAVDLELGKKLNSLTTFSGLDKYINPDKKVTTKKVIREVLDEMRDKLPTVTFGTNNRADLFLTLFDAEEWE